MSRYTWMRRLLPPRHDLTVPPVLGGDLGYRGRAARLVITDDDQLVRLRKAGTPHDRLVFTFDYLRKVLKNADEQARESNDPDTIALLDQVRGEHADQLLVATEELGYALRARGFDLNRGRTRTRPSYPGPHPRWRDTVDGRTIRS